MIYCDDDDVSTYLGLDQLSGFSNGFICSFNIHQPGINVDRKQEERMMMRGDLDSPPFTYSFVKGPIRD